MKTARVLLISTALFLSCLTMPAVAGISFSVSPIRMELAGNPGGSHADAIEVHNEGDEPVRIRIVMNDWYLSETGTPIFQKAGTQDHSCAAWLKINPVDFLLQPGEKKVVRYSVSIPPDTVPGGYWGAFVFQTLPIVKPGQKADAVSLKGNIASIIYVTAGNPPVKGDIIDMNFETKENGATISTRLQNTGTVPFRIKGELKITDAEGNTVASYDFTDAPVLAGFTRTFSQRIEEPLSPGDYTALATIDLGTGDLLAGELPFSVK
jgi:hypothetical protein